MFQSIRNIFARPDAAPLPAIPEGQRVYAVGDVHGRRDLFERLVAAIDAHDASAPAAETTVVLLGDLVDRGEDSAGVIALARRWQQARNVRILAGNHEEMFLRSFEEPEILRHFLRHGGRETILSYGVERTDFNRATMEEVPDLMLRHVPIADRAFIESFEDMIQIGDYVFVHAGINPQSGLDDQKPHDLRWIREPFLSCGDSHGAVVVHGHTITDEPVDRGNRIGIDTGAYTSGRLTALVLQGTARGYIEASEDEAGEITTAMRGL